MHFFTSQTTVLDDFLRKKFGMKDKTVKEEEKYDPKK